MKKILPLLLLAATLSGASVDFRSGKILCAELSTRCPDKVKIDPLLYPELPENKIYAAITVVCHSGRTLSILDYSIELGLVYPCIAIRENGNPFSFEVKRDYKGGPNKKFTMLFVLDSTRIYPSDEELTLKANFPPEQRANQFIRFRRLGDKPFTAPGAIPASGVMPEK